MISISGSFQFYFNQLLDLDRMLEDEIVTMVPSLVQLSDPQMTIDPMI